MAHKDGFSERLEDIILIIVKKCVHYGHFKLQGKKKKKTGCDFRCFFLLLEIKTSAWTGAFKFIYLFKIKTTTKKKKRQQLLALTLAKVLASAMPGLCVFLFYFF